MKKRKLQFDFWTVVTIGIIAVFALFLIYPLISLFIDGFLKEGTGEFTMANFQKFFGITSTSINSVMQIRLISSSQRQSVNAALC